MPTIVRVRCPKGHESEYGKVFINMETKTFRYVCLTCKANHDIPFKQEEKKKEVKPPTPVAPKVEKTGKSDNSNKEIN